MAKKIYDIKPPKVAKKVENTIKEISSPVISSKRVKRVPAKSQLKKEGQKIKSIFTKKNLWIASTAFVLVVGIYLYNSLQSVTIEISPVMQNLSFQNKVMADMLVKEIDLSSNVIPADYIEVEKEGQQEFPATGVSLTDSKATGKITIYNKYDPATPFTLIKGTHFLSDSGKYFVTLSKITIPAAKYQGGKLVPGSVTVDVQAKEVGSDYNIGTSKFSVPKLSGTAYYYSIWAESTSKMVGGSTGKVKKVTKDDLSSAKETLTDKLFNDAESSIKATLSDDDIVFKESTSKEVLSSSASDQAESTVDNFTQNVKVKVSILVFKKTNLDKFIKSYASLNLKGGDSLLEESFKIDYSLDAVDTKKGKEYINFNVDYQTYSSINQENLSSSFKGKTPDQIKEIINNNYPGKISEVKVNLWPFWTTKAPNSQNKIKIELNFE